MIRNIMFASASQINRMTDFFFQIFFFLFLISSPITAPRELPGLDHQRGDMCIQKRRGKFWMLKYEIVVVTST